jgi:hypothetical protein
MGRRVKSTPVFFRMVAFMPSSIADFTLEQIAQALGGDICGNGADRSVLAPGPGHGPKDRSMSVKLASAAPDGFLVHSFSSKDDPLTLKDHVRRVMGLPAFSERKRKHKPNGSSQQQAQTDIDDVEARVAAAFARHEARNNDSAPNGRIVDAYDYTDANGTLLYQVLRLEPKAFKQRRPDGNSGWIWNLDGVARVPFNLQALADPNDQSAIIFVFEGEKDALRGKSLALVTTAIAGGSTWSQVAKYFAGREVVVVPDHDKAGRYKAWECADALHGVAASIRVVTLPGLSGRPDDKDFSDWLDADPARGNLFVDICLATPLWTPRPAPPKPAAAKNSRRKRHVDSTIVKYFDEVEQAPEYSDEALALCFAEQHQAQLRYVAFWSKWLIWRACRWIDDSTLHAFSLARKIARTQATACDFPRQAAAIASAKTVAAIERLAKADRRLAAADDQWDADLYAFNTQNPEEMTE